MMMTRHRSADYPLGNTDAEHERLIRKAARVAPITERFFREAGIGPGQRVLDLGSGVGDVASWQPDWWVLRVRLWPSSGTGNPLPRPVLA